jgi:hypothetical protein
MFEAFSASSAWATMSLDEGGAAEHVRQVRARNLQRPVLRCAGRQHHRVVKPLQLGNGHVAADRDVADEAHVVRQRGLLVAPRDGLDRLVIGRHAGADQAVGNRQQVEDVDPHILPEFLLRRFGGVITCRARPDDCDVAHAAVSPAAMLSWLVARCKSGRAGSCAKPCQVNQI